ncbi:MAG: LysM peptidoglycan-binding domain-containing protein [Bacilli bacterium]|nr:LysM peptidoglycan-binding domain-containing protein [Bacilli bacterium]
MKKIIPFTKDIKFNTKIYEITSISLEHNLEVKENNIISGEFIISGDYKMNDTSINTEPFIHGLPFDITLDCKYDMDRIKIDIDDFKFEIINEEILRVDIDVLIEGVELVEMEEDDEKQEIIDEIKPSVIIESRKANTKDEFINDEEELIEDETDKIIDENNWENIDTNDRLELFENTFNMKEEQSINMDNVQDLFKQGNEQIQKVDSEINDKENIVSIFNNFSEKDEKYVSYYVHIVRENDNIDTIASKYGVSVEEIKEYNDIDQITLGNKIIIPYIENETI